VTAALLLIQLSEMMDDERWRVRRLKRGMKACFTAFGRILSSLGRSELSAANFSHQNPKQASNRLDESQQRISERRSKRDPGSQDL
jgi:hypothetical protein